MDQVLKREKIKSTLWDVKIGIATGLTVLIAVIRFTALSFDALVSTFDPVTLAIIALGSMTGLSLMIVAVRRDEYQELIQRVADLAIRQCILDTTKQFRSIQRQKLIDSRDERKEISEEADEIKSLAKWIDDLATDLGYEYGQVESSIDSHLLFNRTTERLVRKYLANNVQSPNMVNHLLSTLSNSYLRAYCEMDHLLLKSFINSIQYAISIAYRPNPVPKNLDGWMKYLTYDIEQMAGNPIDELLFELFEFIHYDKLEEDVWKDLELLVERRGIHDACDKVPKIDVFCEKQNILPAGLLKVFYRLYNDSKELLADLTSELENILLLHQWFILRCSDYIEPTTVNLHVVNDFHRVFSMFGPKGEPIEEIDTESPVWMTRDTLEKTAEALKKIPGDRIGELAEKLDEIVKRIVLEGRDNIYSRVQAAKYLGPDQTYIIDGLVDYLFRSPNSDLLINLIDQEVAHGRILEHTRMRNMVSENPEMVWRCLTSESLARMPEAFKILRSYLDDAKVQGRFIERIQTSAIWGFLELVFDYRETIKAIPKLLEAVGSGMERFLGDSSDGLSSLEKRLDDIPPFVIIRMDYIELGKLFEAANADVAEKFYPLLSELQEMSYKFYK
ncbi:MAG: hypothetical protein ACFFER_09120 [Candidatus Thorarchaeota archaeon]